MPVNGSPLPTNFVDGADGHTAAHNATNQRVNDLQTLANTVETAVAGVTDLQAALNDKQPVDPDLTTIAELDATQPGVLASDGSGWALKGYPELKTALDVASASSVAAVIVTTGAEARPQATVVLWRCPDGVTPANATAADLVATI